MCGHANKLKILIWNEWKAEESDSELLGLQKY